MLIVFVLQVSANNVSGKLNGNKIQCKFDATVVKPSVLKIDALSLGVISGTYSNSKSTFYARCFRRCRLPHTPIINQ